MPTLLLIAAAVIWSTANQVQPTSHIKGDRVRLVARDSLPDLRVIAAAGDRIQVDESGIRVNGERVADVPPELLGEIAEPWDQVVPDGDCLVRAEPTATSGTARYHGLIPSEQIVRVSEPPDKLGSQLPDEIGIEVPVTKRRLLSTLLGIARQTGGLAGFELINQPETTSTPRRRVSLSGKTVREALDTLAGLDVRYSWVEIGGLGVFRPKESWNASGDPLQKPVYGLALTDVDLMSTMRILSPLLYQQGEILSAGVANSRQKTFSVPQTGGTILQVLSAIVNAHGSMCWVMNGDFHDTLATVSLMFESFEGGRH